MTTKTWQGGNDYWVYTQGASQPTDWSPAGEPAAGDDVIVASGDPEITTDAGTIASLTDSASINFNVAMAAGGVYSPELTVSGLTTIAGSGSLYLLNQATFTTGALSNAGGVYIIDGGLGGPQTSPGGSSLIVDGMLTNTGSITISAQATQRTINNILTTEGLSNTGSISLNGPSNATTEIDVVDQQAGFGTTGVLTGKISLSGNAVIQFAGGSITTIGDGGLDDLTLDGTAASIQDKGGYQNSALAELSEIESNSGLSLGDGATLGVLGNLQNDGAIGLDTFSTSVGGTQLIVFGTLTNTSNGSVTIDAKNGDDTITVGGLSQPGPGANGGNITLYGSAPGAATFHLAKLDVTNQAAGFGTAGVLTGRVYLSGDALLQFDGGTITTIGGGTNQTAGQLTLDGSLASVSNGGAQNSALAISSVAFASGLELADGASLTTGDLTNAGSIGLDSYSTDFGTGGTTLTVNGTLTNTGGVTVDAKGGPDTLTTQGLSNSVDASISLDGVNSNLAELNVTSQAAGFGTTGVVTGSVSLYGDSLLQFAGGQLTTIAGNGSGRPGSSLTLDGAQASLSNGGGQNSALTSLTENDGKFNLQDGASLALSGGFTNIGDMSLNNYHESTADTFTVAGTLNNSGTIYLSPDQAATTIDTQGLTNTGTINISGSNDTGTPEAMIDVTNQAAGFGTAGVLSGHVNLYGASSKAVIQFASGGITTIATNGELTLDGTMASLQDADAVQNDAITGLTENDGGLYVQDGASLALKGGLTNTGTLSLNNFHESTADTLTVAGTLNNSGTISLNPDQVATTIDTRGLANTGTINISGSNDTGTPEAMIDVTNQAAGFGTAGVLSGNVNLYGGSSDAVIQFASGGITTIAANSELTLDGTMASIQDADGVKNDAITGLSSVAGTLNIQDGAVLATGGAAAGAANSLTIANAMTDSGKISAGTIDIASNGSLTLANGQANAAITVENGATFAGTGTTSGGSVTVASGGTFNPGGDPGAISTGSISLASGSTFAVDLGGTPQSGNFGEDYVSGKVALGGATFSGSLVDGYTPTIGDTFEIINNDGQDAVSGTFAGLAQGAVTDIGGNDFLISYTGGDGNDVTLTDLGAAVCYASGTRIRTTRGDVAVEHLAVGDLVVTASGAHRPIRWLGHRTLDCRRHPHPRDAMPVRIAAHALGHQRPARDLVVSPGHAICVDLVGEVLIPSIALVNGTTVVQEAVDAVTYWHVELDSHDILLAENLPAESYIDVGNRGFFLEAEILDLAAGPDPARHTLDGYCRPYHADGPFVDAVRARMRRFAESTLNEREAA